MGLLAAATISTASAQVLVTDTFSRDTSVSGGWGAVDNGLVGGESGTVAASYTLDGSGVVDGAAGSFANSRIVLDYNLAADPDVIAGGGFVVEWQVNPGDGDDAAGETGLGREFAGIALSDSNLNPPFGGAGALTNASNETIRFAILPRNSGSVGSLTRTAGNVRTLTAGGNPSSGFNETVFDQATFDDYVNSGLPDPFANDTFYDVRLEVVGDFTAGSSTLITATVGGLTLPQFDIEWGVAGEAYLSGIAFNGPHQYDNLKISAIPEPASLVLAAVGGLALLRRRA
ncbi:MAG: PEP-CTERM sorting domain-containing protein [Planctomycetota bacterium]